MKPTANPDIQSTQKAQHVWQGVLQAARQPIPADFQPWFLQGHAQPLGMLTGPRAETLAKLLPADLPLRSSPQGWVWHAQDCSAQDRSKVLQHIALVLKEQGQITGWRDEAYACWGHLQGDWPYAKPELFRLERAAFRHWGLRSHAAHVHGFTTNGRMWCARRSMNKATDPGLLDNLAAGGLPADESPLMCAAREVGEEAGLQRLPSDFEPISQEVLTERIVPEGWHSERLFVYTLFLQADVQPVNQDGEVSEFMCLSLPEVVQRIKNNEFTPDATCAIASTLISIQP
jgi:8-oxo-dGTP pyrophosphatase MutT (NUDIX family)